jgi:short subunit dehydrogenase-like uncharacterized protein
VSPKSKRSAAIFGAYGHTGRFVVRELGRRGFTGTLSGRDGAKLQTIERSPTWALQTAVIDDALSLDRAIDGAPVVINCAGPFGETAPALLDAAIRAGAHYIDITGEALVAIDTFEHYESQLDGEAFAALPAVGFFGALGDLLATVASGDFDRSDEITIAVGLDSWQPTLGTRLAGERRAGRRVVFRDGALHLRAPEDPIPTGEWEFAAPFGRQEVVGELTTVDVVTISRHLKTRDIHAFLNRTPIRDLSDPNMPPPEAVDASGRSAQQFMLDVVVRQGDQARRLTAHGRDIYAITAPIVAEAAERLLDGRFRCGGVGATAEIFDAEDFLGALVADGHLELTTGGAALPTASARS